MSVFIVEKGTYSQEIALQEDREKRVIGQTFFSPLDIPSTPAEPSFEDEQQENAFNGYENQSETIEIPLYDVNALLEQLPTTAPPPLVAGNSLGNLLGLLPLNQSSTQPQQQQQQQIAPSLLGLAAGLNANTLLNPVQPASGLTDLMVIFIIMQLILN